MKTVRFCRTPIKPEDLTTNKEGEIYQRHMFVCAAMGDQLWSLDELLDQCQHHPELSQRAVLSCALIELIEIGMIQTEESLFLEERVARLSRAVENKMTFDDVRWSAGQMAVRIGGAANMWAMNAIAYGLGGLLRDVTNCIETVYSHIGSDEQFVVTVSRKDGKTPMDLRRELLHEIARLAADGGATPEQLVAIIAEHKPKENAVGVAQSPVGEPETWIRYFGDHLRCLRCMTDKAIDYPMPTDKLAIVCDDFAAEHQRCRPKERGTGASIQAIKAGAPMDGEEVAGQEDG